MNYILVSAVIASLFACSTPQQASTQVPAVAPEVVVNQPATPLTETYWKLIDLNGKPVAGGDRETREAHLILKKEENRIQGHSSCNRFFGSYTLGEMNRISFGSIGSTKMACFDEENVELRFFDVLGKTDSYTIVGDTLSLHRARMAPLAKFVAVYLR